MRLFAQVGCLSSQLADPYTINSYRSVHDEVFGDLNDGGPNYRGLGWIRAAVLSIKSQIGLGVLGIPSILSTLGLVPGILIILFFGGEPLPLSLTL